MAYKLLFRASFRKDLKKISSDAVRRVVTRVDELAADPFPREAKKLRGHESLYRLRIGHYRVVYSVDAGVKVVALIYVRHRKDVYRGL
ncbi:MAG: type II toxin-antitoxin system RelE/ParE family toxin [Truepera sp.]|nr:type II toxin-antitoxin system RelE/ParE family toxin [Truepera sp.]